MLDQDYAQRQVLGQYLAQKWVGLEEDTLASIQRFDFDATCIVLAQPLERLQCIIDEVCSPEDLGELAPTELREDFACDPFEVHGDVLAWNTAQFFGVGVGKGKDVTQEMLDAARAAHHVGEQRDFQVGVERTETRRCWVTVQAGNERDARRAAIGQASNVNFFEHGASEPEYRVNKVKDLLNEPPMASRPRLRG